VFFSADPDGNEQAGFGVLVGVIFASGFSFVDFLAAGFVFDRIRAFSRSLTSALADEAGVSGDKWRHDPSVENEAGMFKLLFELRVEYAALGHGDMLPVDLD
jgi:hypothetical protein